MNKPDFVPSNARYDEYDGTAQIRARLDALEAHVAAQSQPAAELVDVRENEICDDVWHLYPEAKAAEGRVCPSCGMSDDEPALRTPAREVPDSAIKEALGDDWYDEVANMLLDTLRAHGMAIVYREGPGHAE